MSKRTRAWGVTALGLCLLLAGPAAAEIVSLAGFTQATVREYRLGQTGALEQDSATYEDADPASTLPLQVVARLVSEEEDAAGSVAVQFADPRDLVQPNPEEFAVNLALLTTSDAIRHQGEAVARETRVVRFTSADFPSKAAGDTVTLTGLLFVDGALAIFSPSQVTDLSQAYVRLDITIVRRVAGQADRTVFAGSVGLEGGEGGAVRRTAAGDFPTLTLIRSNLAVFVDDFDLFEVLLIPRLTIRYEYDAVVGEEVTLEATLSVTAANAEGEVGVAAVIGSPVDTIQSVIATVQGPSAAARTVAALQQERTDPSGEAAFPAAPLPLTFPWCGWFGLEAMLGGFALAGWRGMRWHRCRRSAS